MIKINTPPLHSWQRDFVSLFDKDCEGKIFVVKSPRQVGKTMVMTLLLLRNSLRRKSVSWFISPTLRQARKCYSELMEMIKNIPCVKRSNASDLIIEFDNGSQLCFGSAEQGLALRGNTVKGDGVLIIDEAAFIDHNTMFAVLFPFVNVNRRPIILVSTPLFKQGAFYDLFTSEEKNIFHFDACDYDLSFFLSEEQKDLYKRTMPQLQYLCEIEGQFIVEQSPVFGDFKAVLSNDFDRNDKSYTVGIDWSAGANGDNTCIAIFNSKKQMVFIKYWNNLDSLQTIDELVRIINEYKPVRVVVEKNSLGKIYFDMLRARLKHILITPFDTTNKSKNDIINNLQILIQKREVQLLDDPQLKLDMVSFQVEETKTHKVTYNAKSGAHDDTIMAVCFALFGLQTANYSIR